MGCQHRIAPHKTCGHATDSSRDIPDVLDVIHLPPGRQLPRVAVVDFDGTLSLIRGGWTDVMVGQFVEQLTQYARPGETQESLRATVTDFVLELNGKPTIFQMQRLADELIARGGPVTPAAEHHAEYLRRLGTRVAERKTAVLSGRQPPDDFLVPGARAFLTQLQSQSVDLTLASGTEVDWVREEAAVLEIDGFFEGRIYGPDRNHPQAFSKRDVMVAELDRLRCSPAALVGIGDGVVETEHASQLGGTAIGVASDERERSGQVEPWKRERLIAAGAHLIVPDFRSAQSIMEWLFDSR
jgi:phosphoglycolate phosphatase